MSVSGFRVMALSVYGLSSQAFATPAKQPESLKDKPRPFNPEPLAPSPEQIPSKSQAIPIDPFWKPQSCPFRT